MVKNGGSNKFKYKKKYKTNKGRFDKEKKRLENKAKTGWRRAFYYRDELWEAVKSLNTLKKEMVSKMNNSNQTQIPVHIKTLVKEKCKGEECPICIEEMTKDDFYVTRCGHFFHLQCFARCHERKKECPMCRTKIINY